MMTGIDADIAMDAPSPPGVREPSRRVLVTGGAGLIGSHLLEALLGRGHHVVCLDDFSTGSPSNIAALIHHPGFEFVQHDVTMPLRIEVDDIYNLACPASPVHYQRDPVKTVRTNVLGALNMLDLAQSTGARILQASTSEIYGDPAVHPQPESYWGNVNPIGPRSCYDEGKRCAETLFFDYHRQYQTQIKVSRIFNTYGPRMRVDDGRVISNFIIQALRGEDITIYGDGAQTRSFCYVDDLVEAMLRLMHTGPDVTGPINIGNPTEFTILELAEEIVRLTNSRSALRFLPLPVDDPRQRRPDICRARATLAWEPKVALTEGLQRTISYFQTLLAVA